MGFWIRHGDVILKQVSTTKGQMVKKKEDVLAEGEVTGHFHRLRCEQMFVSKDTKANTRYLQLETDGQLSHEEHDTVTVPKGTYEVTLQREVDLLGEVRQVMD